MKDKLLGVSCKAVHDLGLISQPDLWSVPTLKFIFYDAPWTWDSRLAHQPVSVCYSSYTTSAPRDTGTIYSDQTHPQARPRMPLPFNFSIVQSPTSSSRLCPNIIFLGMSFLTLPGSLALVTLYGCLMHVFTTLVFILWDPRKQTPLAFLLYQVLTHRKYFFKL